MLAGFSQGAVIALMTGMLYPQHLAGIIALSGLLPHAKDVIKEGSPANRDIPIFIGHGTQDQIVPAALGKSAYDAIKQASYPAEWHTYPMAHSVCPDEIRDISQWMQKIWK
jgi:phospholipase/carboxylesterase